VGVRGAIFCDGDDCLLFIAPKHLHLLAGLEAWYLGYGLRMKVEPPAYEPEQVEFCQSRPVFDGSDWVLCRNPAKAMNTDGFVVFDIGARAPIHNRSVGLCGLSMAAGLPIFDVFYSRLVVTGRTGKFDHSVLQGIGMQHAIQVRAGHRAVSRPVHPDARVSFAAAFGISVSDQLIIEQQIREQFDPCRPLKALDPQVCFAPILPSDRFLQSIPYTRFDGQEER